MASLRHGNAAHLLNAHVCAELMLVQMAHQHVMLACLLTQCMGVQEILNGREAAEVPGVPPHDAGQLQVPAPPADPGVLLGTASTHPARLHAHIT